MKSKNYLIIIISIILMSVTSIYSGEIKNTQKFNFPKINPEHTYIKELLANAFAYIKPKNRLVNWKSGYIVEGWNQDSKEGLFLRSFTQLTAIGEWIDTLANITAGYADNPYISRENAMKKLQKAVNTLLKDQQDPKLSAKGLLGNFLGIQGNKRVGPLASNVEKTNLIKEFGEKEAENIWKLLIDKEWIEPYSNGKEARIIRGEEYGWKHFDGELKKYSDDKTKKRIMDILDKRIVLVIFGDNANLSMSVAKAIGALLSPSLKKNKEAKNLVKQMEKFLKNQKKGYEHLYREEDGLLVFGWNVSKDRNVGWEDGKGNWVIGYNNILFNEFRSPTIFVFLRFGLDDAVVNNLSFKVKPYKMKDNSTKYSLATWDGSAFQAFGLGGITMQEQDNPAWSKLLNNVIDIELDFSTRNNLPGFLSESYTGEDTEYTGKCGIHDIAITKEERIYDAPSLYTLGVAYMLAPERIENFLKSNWTIISSLMTDHGPWEGYNVKLKKAVKFQTSAHTLSFILGAINTSAENMKRYMDYKKLNKALAEFYEPGTGYNFLSEDNETITWSADSSPISYTKNNNKYNLKADKIGVCGINIKVPGEDGISISGGKLLIKYKSSGPDRKAGIKLDRKVTGKGIMSSDIFTEFIKSETEILIEIPLPAVPGMKELKELVFTFEKNNIEEPLDITFSGIEFVPYK